MYVKRLKEILKDIDGELEVYVRNTVNPCGNIQELAQIETSTYQFFGKIIPCLIINTFSSKDLEVIDDDEINDFIKQE